MESTRMNLLVTLDKSYLLQLSVMLKSLLMNNKDVFVDVYVLHLSLSETNFEEVKIRVNEKRLNLFPVSIIEDGMVQFPTSKRFPREMYLRLFSADYLPENLDKILYLDPDIVIINSLKALYNSAFDNHFFMACSHVFKAGQTFNGLRLKTDKEIPYFNSGVILMNLPLMRKSIQKRLIIDYVIHNKHRLFLPDQDVFSALFGKNTLLLDSLVYNLSDRYKLWYDIRQINKTSKISQEWIHQNTSIIHYCGRNKPWKRNYRGLLGHYYHQYHSLLKK